MKTKLILLLLLFTGIANAQKVTLSGDTILKDGKPYALLSSAANSYNLKELSGREIASFTEQFQASKTPQEKIWTVDFLTPELIGKCEVQATGKQQLAELIVKENLFKNGVFNYHAGRFFIRQHQQRSTNPK